MDAQAEQPDRRRHDTLCEKQVKEDRPRRPRDIDVFLVEGDFGRISGWSRGIWIDPGVAIPVAVLSVIAAVAVTTPPACPSSGALER